MGERPTTPPQDMPIPVPNPDLTPRWKLQGVGIVLTGVLVAAGLAGTFAAAGVVARDDADAFREEHERSAANVASNLRLAIQDEESLVVNSSAFILTNPDASNTEFAEWLSYVQAFERYPELQNVGSAVFVPAAELPTYAAGATADPIGPLAQDGSFQVIPEGDRPFYCFSSISVVRDPAARIPAGYDLCSDPALAAVLVEGRDTGTLSYLPVSLAEGVTWLGAQVPIYRGGTVPATVEARRSAYISSFGVVLDPAVVLERALEGNPGIAVAIHYKATADGTFSSGAVPDNPSKTEFALENGWTVEIFGPVASEGILTNGAALAVLIAGFGFTLLVGMRGFLLSTGRARAMRLVWERTAELRGAQAQLVGTARQAGMAEIATNVLHNVGNVLNSVNVSADLVSQKVRRSKVGGLSKAVALMHEHATDLGDFMTNDPRGRQLPAYLDTLAATLANEHESIDEELHRLRSGVAHIKEIVSSQQSLAGISGVLEPVSVDGLWADALRMAGIQGHSGVTVSLDVPDAGVLSLDRHRVLSILVNLISNATQAMTETGDRPRELRLRAEITDRQTVRLTVADNGQGIAPENLTRIFAHGFTTHADGHGFGLHSAAIAAKEMGGGLTVHSDGDGTGATFILDVPFEREAVAV
jgi:signal transduction histidine kinase